MKTKIDFKPKYNIINIIPKNGDNKILNTISSNLYLSFTDNNSKINQYLDLTLKNGYLPRPVPNSTQRGLLKDDLSNNSFNPSLDKLIWTSLIHANNGKVCIKNGVSNIIQSDENNNLTGGWYSQDKRNYSGDAARYHSNCILYDNQCIGTQIKYIDKKLECYCDILTNIKDLTSSTTNGIFGDGIPYIINIGNTFKLIETNQSKLNVNLNFQTYYNNNDTHDMRNNSSSTVIAQTAFNSHVKQNKKLTGNTCVINYRHNHSELNCALTQSNINLDDEKGKLLRWSVGYGQQINKKLNIGLYASTPTYYKTNTTNQIPINYNLYLETELLGFKIPLSCEYFTRSETDATKTLVFSCRPRNILKTEVITQNVEC